MERDPLVTIAIPTRNRSQYVERAVRTALAQTFKDIEVLVSDNDSNDDTFERLKQIDDSRLVLVQQIVNLGMANNWNACLAAARGRYFLLLSDDDYLHSTAVASLLEPLRSGLLGMPANRIGLSWCPVDLVDGNDHRLWETVGGPPLESGIDFLTGMFTGTRGPRFCGIMVRTADARTAGGYRERYSPICDIGNWGRIALNYARVACIQEPLVVYTMHHASTSSATTCATWRRAGETVFRDLLPLTSKADTQARRRLLAGRTPFISGLIATVIMQSVGTAGWQGRAMRESLFAARYMFAPSTVARLTKNVFKLRALSRG